MTPFRLALGMGITLLPLVACGPFERPEQSCLNRHVRAAPATVALLPGGGFEILGSGLEYQAIAITQPSAGPTGDSDEVSASYPKQAMRGLACAPVEPSAEGGPAPTFERHPLGNPPTLPR